MSKIKFVKNKFGNYVPLKTVSLELTQNQIEVLLFCTCEDFGYEHWVRVNSSGIPNKVLDPLIDCLKDLEELNKLINKIEKN